MPLSPIPPQRPPRNESLKSLKNEIWRLEERSGRAPPRLCSPAGLGAKPPRAESRSHGTYGQGPRRLSAASLWDPELDSEQLLDLLVRDKGDGDGRDHLDVVGGQALRGGMKGGGMLIMQWDPIDVVRGQARPWPCMHGGVVGGRLSFLGSNTGPHVSSRKAARGDR